MHTLVVCCSLSEPGRWDYVVTNETMEGTGKQLADIAGRALAGQIGNGIAELQDPDMSQTLANQTVCPSAWLISQLTCHLFARIRLAMGNTRSVLRKPCPPNAS